MNYLIKAFAIAFCLSAFIYSEYLGYRIEALNSLFAMAGFWLLLGQRREVWFWSGFFIGLLWFYWISFSFIYYDLAFLVPLIILSVSLVYAYTFWLIGVLGKTAYLQAFLLLGISFFKPFGFNWLKFELVLLHSYFFPTLLSLGCLLGALTIVKIAPKWLKLLAIPCLCLALLPMQKEVKNQIPLNIELPTMHIPQAKLWEKEHQDEIILLDFKLIEEAIKAQKELIVLPESAFPLYLNREPFLIDKLLEYSKSIGIILGSLTYEDNKFYNSSYFFNEGTMQVAHKIILVPFGEEIPLPEFVTTLINKLFFNGAQDYAKALTPYDFHFKNIKLRNAICFEATTDKLYQGNPQVMIALSNNAWFSPSIQQTLQHLLLEYYAKKYNTTIYHSANSGKSGVILP